MAKSQSPLFFLVALLVTSSHAQSSVQASSTVPSGSSLVGSTTTLITQTISATQTTRTTRTPSITQSPTFSTSNTTTSSVPTSTADPEPIPPQLFPDASEKHGQEKTHSESAFNYYFLFLAIFGLLIAGALWWLHRRRRLRKEQMRMNGQTALERDLDGWVNTRRWFHGTWRHNQPPAIMRREEGLDENGEAPPPYQPSTGVTVAPTTQGPASNLAVPMTSISRGDLQLPRPPEYHDMGSSLTRLRSAHAPPRPNT
ncbi:hypothetical protein BS50DRAFT_582969 [Corynespora cassiicola Philippines]|uniref:Uncharacterized protein n=1 Tax=Corynespora cassiicola Philippines TaxID=1448308 RepID=A0A2T2P6Y9_CORCC|nr:hypothetical protein BS50DRAFT_582969 [Corynespora cassiicola Philippines]